MLCPNCGEQCPDGARFCKSCGNPLEQTQPTTLEANGDAEPASTSAPYADQAATQATIVGGTPAASTANAMGTSAPSTANAQNSSPRSGREPGWYPDPSGNTARLRRWDGERWTNEFLGGAGTASGGSDFPYASTGIDHKYRLVAFVLYAISTVWTAILLIVSIALCVSVEGGSEALANILFTFPLLCIQFAMLSRCWKIYKGSKPNTMAFGVLSLFINPIAGILLLLSSKDK